MATARKSRSSKTPVAEAIDVQAHFVEADDERLFTTDERDEPAARTYNWREYVEHLNSLFPDPESDWKRQAIAITVGVLVSCGIGYAIGSALGFMLIGAAACGVGMFMQAVMFIIGVCISAYFGRIAGTATCEYIADKRIDVLGTKVYSAVTGWFKTEPQGVAA